METERLNVLGASRRELEAFFVAIGERPFRATQVLKWVHQHGVTDFTQMTDLGKRLRARLDEIAEITPPAVAGHLVSRDGTHKWLLEVGQGNCIEAVFIPEEDRGTLCVSSQVGCALNCSFCATGKQGFNRNLSSAEIAGQLWLAARELGAQAITNVVLMGMGEPLLNFHNVVAALELMLDQNAYGLARRRITLSTAGVVPAIRRLEQRLPVSLAVSLHAPDDRLRDVLVPLNRSYPIAELLDACRDYARAAPKANVTFEYALLAGVNDSPHQARALVRLLAGLPAKVNLIPFNPFPGSSYRRPSPEAIDAFRDILLRAGFVTITRKTRGDDIDAACGQLAGRVQPRSRRVTLARGLAARAAASA